MAAAEIPRTTRGPALPARLGIAAGILAFLYTLLISLWHDFRIGGNSWKQGDWLINSLNEPVRRGPFGSMIILASDAVSLDPLAFVTLLQLALLTLLLGLVYFIFRVLCAGERSYFLLLLSPGFFLIFWAADPQGSLRKELIAYCAMALALTFPFLKSRVLILLASLLFVIAMAGHELNVFLFPAFAFIVGFVTFPSPARRFALLCLAVSAVAGGLALLYALRFSQVADIGPICTPLIDRGLGANMCSDAISWLDKGSASATSLTWGKATDLKSVSLFGFSYVLALVPLIFFVTRLQRPKVATLVIVLALLPILPLYVVAVDWGRWLSLHITTSVFILAALALNGQMPIRKPISTLTLFIFAVVAILLTPNHENGLIIGGVLRRIAAVFVNVLLA